MTEERQEEASVEDQYTALCAELNMDSATAAEAWQTYQNIRQNYTLEVIGPDSLNDISLKTSL